MKSKILINLINRLDDIKIKHKLYLLYIICFLIPLLLTDTLIGYSMYFHERSIRKLEAEQISESVSNMLKNEISNASSFLISVYKNSFLNTYLNKQYESPLDYLISYQDLNNRTLLTTNTNMTNFNYVIYTENETVINGGAIQKKTKINDIPWYSEFLKSNTTPFLYFDYEKQISIGNQRKIILVRNMDYYKKNDYTNIVKVEVNYSDLYQKILDLNYPYPIFVVCHGREILSNTAESSTSNNFRPFNAIQKTVPNVINIIGQDISIYVFDEAVSVKNILQNNYYIFIVLFFINIILPMFFLIMLNNSFSNRINELTDVIQNSSLSNLQKIANPKGKDEIGILINRYNRMAERIENLIQTVYEKELKEKNMIVARQKAELLALHSQINPHFLFNILESIRMHSVIKKEEETAEMIQRLAVIQRQYVDWESDNVTIKEELDCVKAYLDLQKYRFGERLNYSIEVNDENTQLYIPRLSIVTFVENSCVHGIEGKSSCCWIFVRVRIKDNNIIIEIEDTGKGMNEEKLSEIQNRMNSASIELLQTKHHVGIINACLRLKIFTENMVNFKVESEEHEGTIFIIKIPLDATVNQLI